MASRRQRNNIMSDIPNEVVDAEKITNMMQSVADWEYPELLRLRDLINELYQQKANAARETVVAKMHTELQELGMSVDDFVAMRNKRRRVARTPAVPKYRSPDGKEWVGRGPKPKWLREFEEGGGNSEDYLIKEEG
jgi:DNA-binding protein H-NS